MVWKFMKKILQNVPVWFARFNVYHFLPNLLNITNARTVLSLAKIPLLINSYLVRHLFILEKKQAIICIIPKKVSKNVH